MSNPYLLKCMIPKELNPTLLWSFIDKKTKPWKSYGFYDNGFYYSGTKIIAKFKFKKKKARDFYFEAKSSCPTA